MIWQDVIINRVLSKAEIEQGIRTIFPINTEKIFITADMYNMNISLGDNIKIVCETWISKADFPFSVTIYLREDSLLPKTNMLKHNIQRFGEFCELLNCSVLIGDNSNNPYTWILISNRVDYELVSIKIGSFDNRERFIVE